MKNGLGIREITDVIAELQPLEGAEDFLFLVEGKLQVIILSDTFYEFSQPLMRRWDFQHYFVTLAEITEDGKVPVFSCACLTRSEAVKALKNLNLG